MKKTCPRYSANEIEIIKKYYPTLGCKGVQKYINRTSDSLRWKTSQMKLRVEPSFRESKVDISGLTTPKTKEAAYLLGLIWGDGHVAWSKKNRTYHAAVTLNQLDFNNVKDLLIDYGFKIYKVKKQEKRWKQCFTAHLASKKLALFLKEHDYCDKSIKTPTKILKKIPKKYHGFFVRGWFDADGSNNTLRESVGGTICIAGSYNQDWSALQKICKTIGIKNSKCNKQIGKRGKGSVYKFGGHFNILRFREFLYPNGDDGIGLKRKALNFFNKKEPKRIKSLKYK